MKKRLLTIATILVASIGIAYAYSVRVITSCGIETHAYDFETFKRLKLGQDENDYRQYLIEINYEKCGEALEPTIAKE